MSASVPTYYPTDLTDSQWQLIEPLLPEANSGPGRAGRPAGDRRRILNGVL
jgi:transposase